MLIKKDQVINGSQGTEENKNILKINVKYYIWKKNTQ